MIADYDEETIAKLACQYSPGKVSAIIAGYDASTNSDMAAWRSIGGHPETPTGRRLTILDDPLTPEWRARVEMARTQHPIDLDANPRPIPLTERQAGIAKMYNAGAPTAEINASFPHGTGDLAMIRAKGAVGRRRCAPGNRKLLKRIMREVADDH